MHGGGAIHRSVPGVWARPRDESPALVHPFRSPVGLAPTLMMLPSVRMAPLLPPPTVLIPSILPLMLSLLPVSRLVAHRGPSPPLLWMPLPRDSTSNSSLPSQNGTIHVARLLCILTLQHSPLRTLAWPTLALFVKSPLSSQAQRVFLQFRTLRCTVPSSTSLR